MSITPVPAPPLPASALGGRRLLAAWPAVALFLLSLVMPWHAGDNTDVSWLIVVCEKIFGGERLYVDILETNPPFSIALYIGPVWLANQFGIAAELAVQTFVYLVFLASLVLTMAVIRRGGLLADIPSSWLYGAIAFLMLILPGNVVGQREHIGTMLFMPMLAMMMWRAQACRPVPLGLAVTVGSAASVLLLVKPHWALGIALPYLVICWRRRTPLAVLTPENFVIGIACVAYLAVCRLWFSVYFENFLPLLMRYYVSLRVHLNLLIVLPLFCGFVTFVASQARRSSWRVDVLVALASAAGFFLATIYLGKYWDNHQYPYLVCLSVALLLALAERRRHAQAVGPDRAAGLRLHGWATVLVLAALAASLQRYRHPEPELAEAISSRYDRPRIVQVSSDLSIGHPLTRMVNGEWMPAYAHDWLGAHALWGVLKGSYAVEDRAAATKVVRDYTAELNALIRDGRPDIILVDASPQARLWEKEDFRPPLWVAWMLENAEYRDLMEDYEEIAAGSFMKVYARRASR
ncbi:MAG: hypothetical protein M3Y43_08805 [Pseudomonadota bacterium]|nr:hypothetical protein [Pseudomonadota bacterium]